VVNSFVRDPLSPPYLPTRTSTHSDSDSVKSEYNGNFGDHHFHEYDIDTENLVNQMNQKDKHKKTPLYYGSSISVYDACVRLIRLSQSLNLDKSKMQILLKELRFFLPLDCHLPKTVFMLFKMTDNDDCPQVCF
jgi:hypothetical protein